MKVMLIFGLIANMVSNLAIALLFITPGSRLGTNYFGCALFLLICLSLIIPSLYLTARGELFKENEEERVEPSVDAADKRYRIIVGKMKKEVND